MRQYHRADLPRATRWRVRHSNILTVALVSAAIGVRSKYSLFGFADGRQDATCSQPSLTALLMTSTYVDGPQEYVCE